MKKILILLLFIFLNISCSDNITELNDDKKGLTDANPEYLFTNAEKALVDQMVGTSVNLNVYRLFSQHWTETTYPDESQYDITTRTIPDNHFRILYQDVLYDLKQAKINLSKTIPATADDLIIYNNKIALIEILTVYSYSVLVDTFGNVPYSEALDIEANPSPKYDDGLTIYKDLIKRLTVAVNSINTTKGSFEASDLIYSGKTTNWKKFANSLKLRLAINLYDVDATFSSAIVQEAVASGVISSNDENTNLVYLSLQPNANPLYADLVVSERNDFVPANTLVNKMNALTDPRRSKYFDFKTGTTTYVGGVYGASNSFSNFSHISSTLNKPSFAGTIFDYSEVEFLLAEAVAKTINVGGTVASHYNAAITASMEFWGVDSTNISSYLSQPNVNYSTAVGNYKQKIGEQAWIALYNRGFECWTSYRRLDFPVLTVPTQTYNNITEVPKRYSYPAREQTLNATNVSAASTAIGGNTLTNKIFWDKF